MRNGVAKLTMDSEGVVADFLRKMLARAGDTLDRPGLADTPKRWLKAWDFYTQGYRQDPAALLTTFTDGAEGVDEMVCVRNIRVYSMCEHHLAPFFGKAHIAYIPDKKVVGLSKLSRLTRVFARRLQVQERLTQQIATTLQNYLQPIGVGVVLECRHLCMECRGVEEANTVTTTSHLTGAIKEDARARQEFLSLIHNGR